MKVKVALLKSRLSHIGGLEKYTTHLARAFIQEGCDVTLLTTGETPPFEDVKLISLTKTSKCSLLHLMRFDHLCQKWLKEHPQDIVFGMERNTFQTHYRAGSGVHRVFLQRRQLVESPLKSFINTMNPLHTWIKNSEKKAFESSYLKSLFTNSFMVKQEILQNFDIQEDKIHVVHNGVEWNAWESAFLSSFPRASQISQPFHFLFIGNGYRRKGLSFLLHGLASLPSSDWILSVIGKDKEMLTFKNLAKDLGLQEKIQFLGQQSHLLPYYQAADVLVIPSLYDPFANVTVEALAMGLYVVSSSYNGGKEVIQPGCGSIIENPTDTSEIARHLESAMKVPKTEKSAHKIRDSIKGLDFSNQLSTIVRLTLNSSHS